MTYLIFEIQDVVKRHVRFVANLFNVLDVDGGQQKRGCDVFGVILVDIYISNGNV